MADAVVIGSGPNGLVAANLLADAGWSVQVVEEQPEPGGAVKTAAVTLPGFRHDLFSAFYPLAAASPVIRAFELERDGLRWCHGPLVLAHPASDGTAVVLSRDLDETAEGLDSFAPGDGDVWRGLYERLWLRISDDVLDAMTRPLPAAPPVARMLATLGIDGALQLGRIGISSVRRFADEWFAGAGAARLFAGNALHADLMPESPPSAFFGLLLCFLGQQYGYPFPEGGAGSLTAALVKRLEARSGAVRCGVRASEVIVKRGAAVGVRLADGTEIGAKRAVLAAVDAPQLFLSLVGRDALPARTLRDLRRFEWDPSTFKVDWALDAPIPWANENVRRSPVVHVADGIDALQAYAGELARGLIPANPYLIFGQYAIGDATRAPAGKETAWAYTHVPQRVRGDARGELADLSNQAEQDRFVERMEGQIEALAPGFGDLVLARHVLTPKGLEERNASLHNGALNGGTAQLHQQLVFRPAAGLGRPETPVSRLYLASSSAHPGGGVHGAPGAIAARAALHGARVQRTLFVLGVAATAVALRRR